MITEERMMSFDKDDLPELSKTLGSEDIPTLVEWLALKDDAVRYRAFLLLQNRSAFARDVYPPGDSGKAHFVRSGGGEGDHAQTDAP